MKKCISCGKYFKENSKYCPYCGKIQNQDGIRQPEVQKGQELTEDTLINRIDLRPPLGIKIAMIIWISGIFLIFLISTGFFVPRGEVYHHSLGFWPFASNRFTWDKMIDYFDFSEFIIYGSLPLVLWLLRCLFKQKSGKAKYRIHPKISTRFSSTAIGAYLIWFFLNFYLFVGVMDDFDYFELEGPSKLWPFINELDSDSWHYYDISEFFAYALIPVLIAVIIDKFKTVET